MEKRIQIPSKLISFKTSIGFVLYCIADRTICQEKYAIFCNINIFMVKLMFSGGYRMTLGEKILFLRTQKNWSQDFLGTKIGVYGRRVSLYENGKSKPSTKTLQKIAEVFDVSMDYLISETPKNSNEIHLNDNSLLPYIEKLDRLDEEEKNLVKSLIEKLGNKK